MTTTSNWNETQVADQFGKVALITGANSGLGLENARALAAKGAKVVMACRNPEKAHAAIANIKQQIPSADLQLLPLDLSSLRSIEDAAEQFKREHSRLDILINNAGVMLLPYGTTEDGFEMQLGTNHLGHFALTGHLLEVLLKTPKARVVTVSSLAHLRGQIHFDDLQLNNSYGRIKSYGQSKLANLLFAYELQRKLTSAGADVISVAAHPGVSATNLAVPMFQLSGMKVLTALANRIAPLIGQSSQNGALPSLMAATDSAVKGGDYYGPKNDYYGPPVKTRSRRLSHDTEIAQRLWEISRTLTGVGFEALEKRAITELNREANV